MTKIRLVLCGRPRRCLAAGIAAMATIAIIGCTAKVPDGVDTSAEEQAGLSQEGATDPRPDSISALLAMHKDYDVVSSTKVSMSRVGSSENILLLHDPSYQFDRSRQAAFDRLIWVPEDLETESHFDLFLPSMGYTGDELNMLKPFIESLGSSHSVFSFADLTGNGRDELLFLSTHGMGTSLLILTVTGGEFVYLMRGTANIDTILSMQLLSGWEELPIEFRLEGILYNTETESPWRWAEYAWDEESGEFVVSGSGILEEEPGA